MFEDRQVSRDAQRIPYPPPGAPRIEPRIDRIRIRIDGVWRRGHIQRWSRLPDRTWVAWLFYQEDPEHPSVAWASGWFAYDPETIRPA